MQLSEFPSSKPIQPVPNWVLYLLFFAYALPGTLGHAPWRGDDVLHIAVTSSVMREGHWLTPYLAGTPYVDWPPLTYWLGAITGKLFSWAIPLHDSIRLSMVAALAAFVWFLRQAAKEIYGQEVASATVLLTLGSLGLLIPAHEMQPQIVLLACSAANLFGVASLRSAPKKGALIAGAATGAAFLANGLIGLVLTIPLFLVSVIAFAECRSQAFFRAASWGLLPLLLISLLWPCLLGVFAPDYLHLWWSSEWAQIQPHTSHLQEFKNLSNLLGWFTWPLWPVVGWSLWFRRNRYSSFGHIIPIAALVVALWIAVTTGPLKPANALPLLVAMIPMAAAELCKLRRGAANAFDWFGVLTFSILGLFLWLAWTGLNLGWPSGLSRNVARIMPGFHPAWSMLELALALALSAGWIASLFKLPFFQLRGAVHWALGVVLTWGMATTLWLSWFDYDRNYKPITAQIVSAIQSQPKADQNCVSGLETGDIQRAGLYYFEGFKLDTRSFSSSTCNLVLAYASGKRGLPVTGAGWEAVWQTSRGWGRLQEKFALYKRTASNKP